MAYPGPDDIGYAEDFPPEDADERLKFRFIDSDIGNFMRRPRTAVAREYEGKAAAILGLLTRESISNPDKIADAAAYLAYGDKAAAAAGELAEEYETARKILDAIASPTSPVLAFGIAMIPLVAQLMRNHEKEIVKPVRAVKFSVKIPFRKKNVSIAIPVRVRLGKRLRSQTVEPRKCADMVFSNPDVMKALKKRGIDVAWPG
jgi:Asp-tRNA(Asn)/Glu-tRNA(Gln) amidotransferase A subunit family amidase